MKLKKRKASSDYKMNKISSAYHEVIDFYSDWEPYWMIFCSATESTYIRLWDEGRVISEEEVNW